MHFGFFNVVVINTHTEWQLRHTLTDSLWPVELFLHESGDAYVFSWFYSLIFSWIWLSCVLTRWLSFIWDVALRPIIVRVKWYAYCCAWLCCIVSSESICSTLHPGQIAWCCVVAYGIRWLENTSCRFREGKVPRLVIWILQCCIGFWPEFLRMLQLSDTPNWKEDVLIHDTLPVLFYILAIRINVFNNARLFLQL